MKQIRRWLNLLDDILNVYIKKDKHPAKLIFGTKTLEDAKIVAKLFAKPKGYNIANNDNWYKIQIYTIRLPFNILYKIVTNETGTKTGTNFYNHFFGNTK